MGVTVIEGVPEFVIVLVGVIELVGVTVTVGVLEFVTVLVA